MNWRNQNKRLILFLIAERNGNGVEWFAAPSIKTKVFNYGIVDYVLFAPSNSSPFPLPFLLHSLLFLFNNEINQSTKRNEVRLVGMKTHNPLLRLLNSLNSMEEATNSINFIPFVDWRKFLSRKYLGEWNRCPWFKIKFKWYASDNSDCIYHILDKNGLSSAVGQFTKKNFQNE